MWVQNLFFFKMGAKESRPQGRSERKTYKEALGVGAHPYVLLENRKVAQFAFGEF